MVRLLGYPDSITVRPGGQVSFKISGDGDYRASLVRLTGVSEDGTVTKVAVPSDFEGTYTASRQPLTPGSYADIEPVDAPEVDGLAVQIWVQPAIAKPDRPQVIAAFTGTFGTITLTSIGHDVELLLDARHAGSDHRRHHIHCAPGCLRTGSWHRISAAISFATGDIHLEVSRDGRWPAAQQTTTTTTGLGTGFWARPPAVLQGVRFAAGYSETDRIRPGDFFNGRLEEPQIFDTRTLRGTFSEPAAWATAPPIAHWDFSAGMESLSVIDLEHHQWHGTLINRPTRAVIGHRWRAGDPVDYAQDRSLWNAIHFHEDDLADAGWATSFTHRVPDTAPSGIYAVQLRGGGTTEYLPFYVAPPPASDRRVLFLAPTNTYLAYANEHLSYGERGQAHEKSMTAPLVLNARDQYVHSHPELGLSIYDTHIDGSGVVYSSWDRPVLNVDPDYITWLNAGRRHFAADFYITGWLDSIGVPFDVATDQDLDECGIELLAGYDVVITGTHPEYPTLNELDALIEYTEAGGSLMYLGGNGFYWVTTYDDNNRRILEVRRGCAGQRNWTSHPAETYHSSTHVLGGITSHAGRNSRELCGVTSAACGWGPASPYERTERSYASDVAFLFDGVSGPVIGTEGLSLGAAAGDEVDSADYDNGTPASAIVLLTARLGPTYNPFTETVMGVESGQNGPFNDRVRSDVVLMPTGINRGAVFSASSICWAGSMAVANYRSDTAVLTENVLRWMLDGYPGESTRENGATPVTENSCVS